MNDYLTKVLEIVGKQPGMTGRPITPEESLIALGLTSMNLITIVMELEKAYSIQLSSHFQRTDYDTAAALADSIQTQVDGAQ